MPDRVISYNFRANFGQFSAGLAAMGKSVESTAVKLTALDKNGVKLRSGLTQVGSAAGKVGLLAAAGVGVAIAAAANFEQAMSNVSAATHETSSNMALLRQAALDAGQATQYSATESAGAIEELAKAGVSTKDILAGGLTGALNLAAAGGLDVADAAETAASAMTEFSLSGQDVGHIADLLAAGAGKAQGSVGDLGMALSQSGLVAAQTGLSIEETVGALAEFANAGLIGSDAGTSFKTMLQALSPSSQKAADLMASLGLSAYDAQGNFVGMANYAGQLKESLSKLSVEQQNAALKTIFGSDSVRAASIIFKDGAQGVQEWQHKVNDSGYAADTAAIKMDNLKGDLEQLGGAFETALIGAGGSGQGPLRSLVQGATDAVNAFNKLPSSAKSAVTALGGITAVIGGGLWFTSKTVNGISSMREALTNLGISAEKSSKAMKGLGIAAGVAVGVESLFIAIDQLNKKLDESLPGANALEGRLIDLANGAAPNLGSEFNSLSDSIARVADGRWDDGLSSFFDSLLPGDTRAKSLREASTEIDLLDQSLASLVQSGHADTAAAALANLGLSGERLKQLKQFLPGYNEALAGTSNDTKLATDATTDFGTAQEAAKQQVQDMKDELRKQQEAARGTATSFAGLGDSLNDSKVSLSDWIDELAKQNQALREFTRNAETAARRGLDQGLIASLQAAGPEGALRLKQLADAADSELTRANRAWRGGRQAVKDYIKSTTGAKPPKLDANAGPLKAKLADSERGLAALGRAKATPSVTANTSAATKSFNQVDSQLSELDKFRASPSVGVQTGGALDIIGNIQRALANLNGTTAHTYVTTSPRIAERRAEGGTIGGPREPYGDKILTMLAPGEEVISNRFGQADKFRSDRAAGRIPGYADGGTVTRSASLSQAVAGDGTQAGRAAAYFAGQAKKGGDSLKGLKGHLEDVKKKLDKVSKSADSAHSALDDLKGQRDSLRSSVSQSLTHDPFQGGLSDFSAQVGADAADATAMLTALQTLVANGLDPKGALFQQLAASGKVSLAQQFASLSRGDLATYASSFNAEQGAVKGVSDFAGNQAFGDAIKAQTKVASHLDASVKHFTQTVNKLEREIDKMGKKVHDGAKSGTKEGQTEKSSETARRVRTHSR